MSSIEHADIVADVGTVYLKCFPGIDGLMLRIGVIKRETTYQIVERIERIVLGTAESIGKWRVAADPDAAREYPLTDAGLHEATARAYAYLSEVREQGEWC